MASIGSGHRVVEDALTAAGLTRRIALRVPHFMVVPMILERTDLLVTVPETVARIFARDGRLRLLPPPVRIPRTDVRAHWHERFERDAASRWMRGLLAEMFAPGGGAERGRRAPAGD